MVSKLSNPQGLDPVPAIAWLGMAAERGGVAPGPRFTIFLLSRVEENVGYQV